ncbi:phage gp6-like head-tail connector protein [Methylobacterium sp. W2]|uniref:head-tail connector protein n=1 Tax=Methylobacterium sp. W2 TaxID=2598107 RepID=UPI001D0C0F15|nr:head-tail connector protein [Methylobacterium sp. W2]MCC0806511.1 phage gp6-like head-tail connector protein [Methylobacterium sp. W2]
MRAVVVTPSDPIVSLAQAKKHLRVEHGDDDDYIADLVAVATGWLDAPDGWLGRALGLQTLEMVVPARLWSRDRQLPFPPLVEIVSVTASDDGETTVVRFKAGHDFAGNGDEKRWLGPAPIRHAILLMVGHLYGNREAVSTSAAKPEQLPLGVDALLSPFRVMSV